MRRNQLEACTCHILREYCLCLYRQGPVSPRRALAAANTSPPLPTSPDQASISLAPGLPAHERSPVPDGLGMEEAFIRAQDAMKGEEMKPITTDQTTLAARAAH